MSSSMCLSLSAYADCPVEMGGSSDLNSVSEKLAPGMPFEVYIETEERASISCLAKPFMDKVMKGFREE